VLYQQMLGRGLRKSPATGKEDCIVLDFVDNVGRNSAVTTPSLMGLAPSFNAKGEDVYDVYHQVKEAAAEVPAAALVSNLADAAKLVDQHQLGVAGWATVSVGLSTAPHFPPPI
jgi:ATP-dependent helicase IRC3